MASGGGDRRAYVEVGGPSHVVPWLAVRVDWIHNDRLRRLLEKGDRQLARKLGITDWS